MISHAFICKNYFNLKAHTLNQLLNIALSTQWQNNTDAIVCDPTVLSWLLDASSLTKKLEMKSQVLTVEVKQQVKTDAKHSPLSAYFQASEKVLVREVLLKCDGIAHVFAQTEIPSQTLSNKHKKLESIGTTSLGKFLFQEASLKRSDIEIAEFLVGSPAHQLCHSLQQTCNHSLWARRSLFYIENKPLLVTEVFLPASGIY